MGFLAGKRILITGLASSKSIAYGVAQAMYREGSELAFTYQSDRLKDRLKKLASSFSSTILLPCDVLEDNSIVELFVNLSKIWNKFDGFVHSIAFAPRDKLVGDYIDTIDRDSFILSHNVSSYSFVAMAKACKHMLNVNSSLVTMTYLGSVRATPYYNVMGPAKASLEANTRYMANAMGPFGIRVNAVSSGPISTLAATGIKNFKKMLIHCEKTAPMRRKVTVEDIGNVVAFLCSNLSSGITGEIIYVDCGFNIVNMVDI